MFSRFQLRKLAVKKFAIFSGSTIGRKQKPKLELLCMHTAVPGIYSRAYAYGGVRYLHMGPSPSQPSELRRAFQSRELAQLRNPRTKRPVPPLTTGERKTRHQRSWAGERPHTSRPYFCFKNTAKGPPNCRTNNVCSAELGGPKCIIF